ncbi:MAG TPA: hypothetical protein VHS03_15220, partial [Gaiellaceae bacterium]|nr:hypothetical protein [Gaiellaceae bacterium]
TLGVVRSVVRGLLEENEGFRALKPEQRLAVAHDLVHVGSYLAECIRDDWVTSERQLGQRPLIRTRAPLEAAEAAADDFRPAAVSQVAGVTRDTLRAVAFPVFVADLIRSTFDAIGDASQKQMESYMELLSSVSMTVDEYMRAKITDDAARSWLVDRYPRHIKLDGGHAAPADNQPEGDPPDFTADLDLTESVDPSDGTAIEDTLVPAARRKLAQSRLKVLSTLVLMGINRIVVTGGKIRATMGFHINARDTAHQESASSLDTRVSAKGGGAIGPFSVSASVSVAYVSSSKADSNAELNVQTDLTGEVEIHFQSDYFPIERFADAAGIDRIRSNTPVPAANTPMTPAVHDTIPWGDTTPAQPVERLGPVRQPTVSATIGPDSAGGGTPAAAPTTPAPGAGTAAHPAPAGAPAPQGSQAHPAPGTPPAAHPAPANPPAARPPAANPPAGNPPAANPPAGNPPAANPPAANPPAANPPAANPPAGNPPAANPPAANPPAGNPPAANPPVANPPVANPSPASPTTPAPA